MFSGGQLSIHHKTFLPDSPEKGMVLDQEAGKGMRVCWNNRIKVDGNADQPLLRWPELIIRIH